MLTDILLSLIASATEADHADHGAIMLMVIAIIDVN